MVCVLCSAAAACPPGIQFLAVIGAVVIYILIALLIQKCIKEVTDSDELLILGSMFWPIAIIIAIIFGIGYWFAFPFIGATKKDLRESEERISELVSTKKVITSENKSTTKKKLFKVGDIITGVPGNPDNYEHLYEGCKCRVLSSDEIGSMRMILLDHKDREAHEKVIGKVFKGPARNFILWKKSKK